MSTPHEPDETPPNPVAKKTAAKKAAKPAGVTEPAPDEVGERAMTKSGRPLVIVTAGDLPPPPPPVPLGTVLRKDKIAAAYYERVSDSNVPFKSLGVNDQLEWYKRAMNAGGPK